MDETLLRRLVGAAVLLLGALLAAALLPGHPPDPAARVAPAGGAVAEPAAVAVPPAVQSAAEPPTAADPGAETADEPPRLQLSSRLSAPEARPRVAPAGDVWFVQVGSYSNPENARSVARALRQRDMLVVIEPLQSGGRVLQRVRVGPYGNEQEARAALGAVGKAGYRGAKLAREVRGG